MMIFTAYNKKAQYFNEYQSGCYIFFQVIEYNRDLC